MDKNQYKIMEIIKSKDKISKIIKTICCKK
jgi:hypothetical protein